MTDSLRTAWSGASMSAIGVGTGTHWLRQINAYGGPPRAAFLVQLWWPESDPKPVGRQPLWGWLSEPSETPNRGRNEPS